MGTILTPAGAAAGAPKCSLYPPHTPSFSGKHCGFPISTTTLLSSFTSLPPSYAPAEVGPCGESLRHRQAPGGDLKPLRRRGAAPASGTYGGVGDADPLDEAELEVGTATRRRSRPVTFSFHAGSGAVAARDLGFSGGDPFLSFPPSPSPAPVSSPSSLSELPSPYLDELPIRW
jgi:hypothetical protein